MDAFLDRSPLLVVALSALWFLAAGCDALNSGGGDSEPLLPPRVHAVDADASGDATGATWNDAYTSLQVALDSAEAGDEIWIAEGTYVPSEPHDPADERTASFIVLAGVSVYGGFSGNELEREERSPETNATILSGDRGRQGETDDNSYHVVVTEQGPRPTSLKGVTISRGNADGEGPNNLGGGLLSMAGTLTLQNVTFKENKGEYGAALFDSLGTTRVESSVFTQNVAERSGGGSYVDEKSETTFTEVILRENEAKYGGGVYSDDAYMRLQSVDFVGNRAESSGGGTFLFASSAKSTTSTLDGKRVGLETHVDWRPTRGSVQGVDSRRSKRKSTAKKSGVPSLENVSFEGNRADYGGGLYNLRSDFVADGMSFIENQADSTGGGLINVEGRSSVWNVTFRGNEAQNAGAVSEFGTEGEIIDARFVENTAQGDAGAALLLESKSTYANVVFYGNEAFQGEGGAVFGIASDHALRGVTAVRNRAANGGNALAGIVDQATVVNSIFWENGETATEEVDASSVVFRHSLVRGSGGSSNWNSDYGNDGGGNLDQSPEFASLSADALRLMGSSPAVDAGRGNKIESYDTSDLAENPRIVDGDGDGNEVIDMGAYEYQP